MAGAGATLGARFVYFQPALGLNQSHIARLHLKFVGRISSATGMPNREQSVAANLLSGRQLFSPFRPLRRTARRP
jgi:hypothetical protein